MEPLEGGMLPDRGSGPAGFEMAQPRSSPGHDHGFARTDLDNPDRPAECGQRHARQQSIACVDGRRSRIEAEHLTFVPAVSGGIVCPALGEGFEAGGLDAS